MNHCGPEGLRSFENRGTASASIGALTRSVKYLQCLGSRVILFTQVICGFKRGHFQQETEATHYMDLTGRIDATNSFNFCGS